VALSELIGAAAFGGADVFGGGVVVDAPVALSELIGAAGLGGAGFFGGGYVVQKWRPHFGHSQN
tara:strand:- start:407 stop:598 length:192 start_codon:yes stop_codon:yes gene_type:complete